MMLKQWNELRNDYRTFEKNNLEKRIEFEKKNKELDRLGGLFILAENLHFRWPIIWRRNSNV